MLEILIVHQDAYIRGLIGTLRLALSTWLIGLSIGIPLGALGFRCNAILRANSILNFFVQSTPILVSFLWLHYPAQAVLNITVEPYFTALLALSFCNVVSVATIIQRGLKNLPENTIEMAQTYGLPARVAFCKIFLPLILKQALAPLISLQILMLHMTLFSSLISYEELFRISLQLNATIYKPVEIFSILAIFFIAISLPFIILAHHLSPHTRGPK